MPFRCDIQQHELYLLVTLSGELRTIDEAASIAEQVIPAAQQGGYFLVLQDERELAVEMDVHDTLVAADQVGEIAPWSGICVASVRSSGNWEIGKVTETLLQNRSVNFKVFKDYDEAVAWLLSGEG